MRSATNHFGRTFTASSRLLRSKPLSPGGWRPSWSGRAWILALGAFFIGSCAGVGSSEGAGETINSEAFVEAIIALRTSELLDSSGYLPQGEPERILSEHGLVPDDLRRFVEAHGEDVPMMAGIWEEIERRVNEIRNLSRS